MTIWSAEIKDIEKLYDSFKDQHPKLDKELEKLIKADDENMVLVYSRRCLEVIITDLSERELKRPRGTEPLKGIIDKLNREEKVPHNIIVSMQNLNSLSTFGAHPKDFDPRQVKPVILDLATTLEWYLKYLETQPAMEAGQDVVKEKRIEPSGFRKASSKPGKRIIMVAGILLAGAIIIVSLIVFDIIGGGKKARAESIESLVILPFSNYTGDETLETFVSGMHTCLIADMGRLSGLRVINTTTSNVYKNTDMSVHEIAIELNVEAAIEVSVLSIRDSIIIKVNLISAFPEEETVWIGDYREGKSQLLNLYDRIIKQIADEVKIELTADEERLLAESRTVDPEALVAYMKGQFHWERLGKEDLDSAIHYFRIAIEKDPNWADPYAGMSMTWLALGHGALAPQADSYDKASEYLYKALELDPNSANSHYVKAMIAFYTEWAWEKSEKEFLKSLELNPSNAMCRIYYAHLLLALRRSDETKYQANLALALDPLQPLILGLYSGLMHYLGDHQAALIQAEKALSIDPDNNYALSILTKAYLETGDTLKWHEAMKKIWYWADEEYLAYLDTVFQEGGYLAVIKDRIRVNEEVYGKGGTIAFVGQADRYMITGDYDKAMDYLEKAYEVRSSNLVGASFYIDDYPELKDNPRYVALLKKMNLPLK